MPVPSCAAVTLSSWYRGVRTVDRLGAAGPSAMPPPSWQWDARLEWQFGAQGTLLMLPGRHICLSGMSAMHSVIAAGLSPSVFRCSACI